METILKIYHVNHERDNRRGFTVLTKTFTLHTVLLYTMVSHFTLHPSSCYETVCVTGVHP